MIQVSAIWISAGYSNLVRSPSLFLHIAIPEGSPVLSSPQFSVWKELRSELSMACGDAIAWSEPESKSPPNQLLSIFIDCLKAQGNPEIDAGLVVLHSSERDNQSWRLQIPIASHVGREQHFRLAVQALVSGANGLVREMMGSGEGLPTTEKPECVKKSLQQFMVQLKHCVPGSRTRSELLRSAQLLGIPWREVAPGVYQLGWGQNSRVMDSTHTDKTSVIAMGLAKQKRACSDFLGKLGFPVVAGWVSKDVEVIVRAASAIGYPVVLKPSGGDGGESVFTGLANEADVRWAFDQISVKFLPAVVERHFEGRDYRLHVWHHEIFYVVERTPASIVGDGRSSVESLVVELNQKRQRQDLQALGEFDEVGTKPIVLDGESTRWLERQGLTSTSVPKAGRVIRLKGAANVSKGGTRRKVPLSEVHPDNVLLVTNAMRAIRLDVAGVDLLIPDIGISWHSSGASICEVNSQPQMFEGFEQLLKLLVPDNGRIKITLVVAHDSMTEATNAFSQVLVKNQRFSAVIGPDLFLMNGALQCQNYNTHSADSQLRFALRALGDQRVEHLVYLISPQQLNNALPFDSVDYLIVESSILGRPQTTPVVPEGDARSLDMCPQIVLPSQIAWLVGVHSSVLVIKDRSNLRHPHLSRLIGKYERSLN